VHADTLVADTSREDLPAGHKEHAEAPSTEEYWPSVHAMHSTLPLTSE